MRLITIHLGVVYNVFSVRVRAFVPLSAPCGVRIGHLSCSVVLKTAPSRVQCVFFAMWRACKAPCRVQWYPKTAPSRAQCVFFRFFFSCRPHTRGPSKRETKRSALILGSVSCTSHENPGTHKALSCVTHKTKGSAFCISHNLDLSSDITYKM